MISNKIFRLFVSSTFSDFSKEREVLQTSVFPKIREYASSKGYTFQPIDLRWGVSNEAQLDQKTLELCLEEVRSCKTYPHPNFLIMIGDRYGWVPLPYAVEENEFKLIKNEVLKHNETETIHYNGTVSKETWYGIDDKVGLKTKLETSTLVYSITNVEPFLDSRDDNKEKIRFSVERECLSSELLDEWYEKDLNQIPPSYILKERQNEFETYDIWIGEEDSLRKIFQKTVKEIKFDEDEKKDQYIKSKYFISATEAEVEEGIFPYMDLTDHQESLLKKDQTLEAVDPKYVFGFLRNINKNIKNDYDFIDDDEDYSKAQKFKENIKKELENILDLDVNQKDEKSLDERYLDVFKEEITQFLMKKIDELIKKEDEEKHLMREKYDETIIDELLIRQAESDAQKFFAEQKRKNFINTTELKDLRTKLCTYIEGDVCKPMVIHGSSGSGKSAFMAHTINFVERMTSNSKKIISRFIGATPYTSSSKELLLSIFDELDTNMRIEGECQVNISEVSLDSLEKNETFDVFSDRINDAIMQIDEDIIIFIDAVDQLTSVDQFRWLPHKLPSNVKIIISALFDHNYKKENEYFEVLQKKSIIVEIPEFNEPVLLLKVLLKRDNRTIQKDQVEYFQKQFKKVGAPLYVSIAAEEVKYWKSNDYVENNMDVKTGKKQSLVTSQKGIIKEFIENLSKLYHHDERFVHKVLGYLYASKDGLSESELLQLISTDDVFIKQMAPETWHNNTTKELPMVLWTRLYSQLKPFLSMKEQDGEKLLYFFHREFEDVVRKLPNQEKEYKDILVSTQILIKRYQHNSFNENRWGKLYIQLVTNVNNTSEKDFLQVIVELENYNWINEYLFYGYSKTVNSESNHNINMALSYGEHIFLIAKKMFIVDSKKWVLIYSEISTILFYCYYRGDANKSLLFLEKVVEEVEHRLKFYMYTTYYFTLQLALASGYGKYNSKKYKGINILEKLYNNIDKLKDEDTKKILEGSILIQLGYIYSDINNSQSIFFHEKNLKLLKDDSYPLSGINKDLYLARAQNALARSLSRLDEFDNNKIIKLYKNSYKIRKKFYKINNIKFLFGYLESLNDLSIAYRTARKYYCLSLKMQEKRLKLIENQYLLNKNNWKSEYYGARITLATLYEENSNLDKAYDYLEKNQYEYDLLLEHDYEYWVDNALKNITELIMFEDKYNRYNEKNKFLLNTKKIEILKKLCELDCNSWIEEYFSFVTLFIDNFTIDNNVEKMIDIYENSLAIFEFNGCNYKKNLQYKFESNFCYDLVEIAVKYHNNDDFKNAKKNFKKLFFYAEQFLEYGNDSHIESYILGLINYATFIKKHNKNISIGYGHKAHKLNEYMYCKYKISWKHKYELHKVRLENIMENKSTKIPFLTKSNLKIKRNEQCFCRSGRKYKHCHGKINE